METLFAAFPSAHGDPKNKYLGYLDALAGEPAWAVEKAVRRFRRGEVSSHDGRFLPTSAELARVVREESGYAKRMAEREARPALTDQRTAKIDPEKWERRYKQLKDLAVLLGGDAEPVKASETITGPVTVTKELVEALDRQKQHRGDKGIG